MRIMGPNCLGRAEHREQVLLLLRQSRRRCSTPFSEESGSISYIIQSGGIVVIVLESFADRRGQGNQDREHRQQVATSTRRT
ncbi:MAG: hypothetical protein M0C28_31690 [Candidatus Moduliflexus flocculans]|nr:hypothetical protein [Candidatus Moduliflexus flocculans]